MAEIEENSRTQTVIYIPEQQAEFLYIWGAAEDHEWSSECNGSRSICMRVPENEGRVMGHAVRRVRVDVRKRENDTEAVHNQPPRSGEVWN